MDAKQKKTSPVRRYQTFLERTKGTSRGCMFVRVSFDSDFLWTFYSDVPGTSDLDFRKTFNSNVPWTSDSNVRWTSATNVLWSSGMNVRWTSPFVRFGPTYYRSPEMAAITTGWVIIPDIKGSNWDLRRRVVIFLSTNEK